MGAYTIVAAILIAITFLAFIYYCFKGGNLLIGLFVIASIWTILATIYMQINQTIELSGWNLVMRNIRAVFHEGPVHYGETTAIIIFASWFGRVLVDTGIASSLIKRVVELAGAKQLVTVLVVSIVSSALFMSIFGPGSVIAMGQIILPIFFSIGVRKEVAVGAFLMSVASGMYVNGGYVSQFSGHDFFRPLFDQNINNFNSKFTTFTWIATALHIAVMITFIVVNYMRTKDTVRTLAVNTKAPSTRDVPSYTFVVPFIPILMALGVNILKIWFPGLDGFPVIFNFIAGIFFGLLLTGNFKGYRKAVESVQKTLQNGISDVALLIGMLLMMNTFAKAAGLIGPIISAVLGDSLDWVRTNPLIIVIAFMILAPLALYRGPLMIWGSGIALTGILSTVLTGGNPALVGTFPLLMVLFYTPPVAITADSCPTQSWNMWALSYSDYEPGKFVRTNILWAWALCAVNIFLAYMILM